MPQRRSFSGTVEGGVVWRAPRERTILSSRLTITRAGDRYPTRRFDMGKVDLLDAWE